MNAVDSHKSYRPLTVLTFRSDWNLSGGAHDPALSHTVNILLHGLVTALVCALACALFPGPGSGWTAFASGTLFAVHPVHVEAVVGVVSRADLIATAAFILGYLHYTTSRCSGSSAWRLWPLYAMCLYTALLAKEIGLFLVPVCMLWELCRCPLRKIRCLSYCAGLAFLAVPYLALRTYLSSHTLSLLSITSSTLQHSQLIRKAENPFAFLTGWDWIRSVNYLQAKYAQLLFFPSELCAEYSFDCIPAVVSWMDPRNALSLALNVAAVLGFAHCFVNRDGAVTSLVALVVIPYIPASNLFFVIGAASLCLTLAVHVNHG